MYLRCLISKRYARRPYLEYPPSRQSGARTISLKGAIAFGVFAENQTRTLVEISTRWDIMQIRTIIDQSCMTDFRQSPSTRRAPLVHGLAWPLACLFVCAHMLIASSVAAAPSAGQLGIELNKLEPHGDTCRPYLVFSNQTDKRFESLALELVLFDGEGFILKRFSLDAAPLAPGKTSVKLFEVEGVQCDALGRILLNAVTACADTSGALDDCLERIRPSSRLPVEFFK